MYIEDRKEIRIEDVKAIVKEIPEDDIFDFVDAIMFDKREKLWTFLIISWKAIIKKILFYIKF